MFLVYSLVVAALAGPFFWGSVYPWTTALLVLVVAGIAARLPSDWFRGPRAILYSLYGLFSLFCLTVVLQLLTNDLSLAPNEIWSLASDVLGVDLPKRTAVDLSTMLWEIGPVILYGLTFWVSLAVGSDRLRTANFLQWTVWGSAILVGITFFMHLSEPRLLLWIEREHYANRFTHGFVNPNSAASYLGTCALLALGLMVGSLKQVRLSGRRFLSPDTFDELLPAIARQVVPHLLAFIIFIVGLVSTGSRAGILLTGVSALVLIVLFVAKSNRKGLATIWIGLLFSVLAVWTVQSWGGSLSERLYDGGITDEGREKVYPVIGEMITDYPLLGVGLGGFVGAFPAYRPDSISPLKVWDKAHNTLLEIAVEMGVPFTSVLVLFWILVFFVLLRGVANRRRGFIYPAIGASVWLLATLHSMVDFPLQIPGHTVVVLSILGICVAQTVPRHGRT